MIKKLEQPAIDFLLYDYFGITKDDDKDKMILKCAQRAYRDLCRTLKFTEKADNAKGEKKKQIEKAHQAFRMKICELIQGKVKELLCSQSKEEFDEKHASLCSCICETDKGNVLSVKLKWGQAQKWLNMTIKYMWLIGLWERTYNRSAVHIPVDNYIIQAIPEGVVTLPSSQWSQWDQEPYEVFQQDLRKWRKESSPNISPLEWEAEKWLDQAQDV